MTTAIILAGGLGTRLRSSVPHLPKPMAPIGGRPFLEHMLDYWIGQGVTEFILSVGYMHDRIMAHFGTRYSGREIRYSIETEPLGTGGGLLLAARMHTGNTPFLLLNGDTYFAVELSSLRDFASSRDADWCFALSRNPDATRYMGMSVEADGRISALRVAGSGLINGGVYWIDPRAWPIRTFSAIGAFSLENDYLPAALSGAQRLFGVECAGTFLDIGLPADYARASDLLPSSKLSTERTIQ